MPESELYKKGAAMRRQLMGDKAVEAAAKGVYSDPVMQKFLDVATETVFGALWTRPGLDTQDPGAHLRHLRYLHGARAGAGAASALCACAKAGPRRS
jgi:hypothetical protein